MSKLLELMMVCCQITFVGETAKLGIKTKSQIGILGVASGFRPFVESKTD